MLNDLEEEMRRALFGDAQTHTKQSPALEGAGIGVPATAQGKRRASKAFAPRLRVIMHVGNDFEGETYELVHEASTLSTLLAEQEAVKAARKKYRYVEVVSVRPV